MAKYLMGLDCGGTSIKAVVFDERGTTVGSVTETFKRVSTEGPQYQEFNLTLAWEATKTVLKKVLDKVGIDPKDLLGIGCTSFGNGCTFLGKGGEVIANGCYSTDYRANDAVQAIKAEGNYEKLCDIVKCGMYSGEPGAILRWYKMHRPDIYAKIEHVFSFKDFIAYRLTGVAAADMNCIGGSALVDLEKLQFSKELMELYGIPEMYDKLPYLAADSSETVGYVTKEAAAVTGLAEGTAIVAGMMDILACLVGAGATEKGVFTAIAGTWSINETFNPEIIYLPGSNIFNMPYLDRSGYLLSANTGASASNYEWFMNTLGSVARKAADQIGLQYAVDTPDIVIVNQVIKSVPVGGTTVLYHPFVGQPSVHGAAMANFFNINDTTTFAELAYALAEGVAFIHRFHYDQLGAGGLEAKVTRLTGGIARSDEWAQLFADALNTPVECVACDEVGALGLAMCAGIGAGLYKDYADAIEKCVRLRPRINPIPGHVEKLNKRYEEWLLLIETMKPYWDWKAANK